MVTPTRNGSSSLIDLAGTVVSAYVSNNPVPSSELPKLINRVHHALGEIINGRATKAVAELEDKATPEQIGKSVTPDALISFIDGKPYKTLKRHLAGHGLDPFTYRKRYGLPSDYPMVSPNYALRRSEIARGIALGASGGRGNRVRSDTHR